MSTETIKTEIIDTKQTLVMQAKEFDVEESTALSLADAYHEFALISQAWEEDAKSIVVTSVDDVEGMKEAKTMRLKSKVKRGELEKVRKSLKHDALEKGKAVDAVAKVFREKLEGIEAHLQAQEDFAKIQRENEIARLQVERKTQLDEYGFESSFIQLGEMQSDDYATLLSTSKTAFESKAKAAQDAIESEHKRIEEEAEKDRQRIAAEAAERARIEEENTRLKKEREEREAQIEKERLEQEAALKAEREQRDKELAAERAKAEQERIEREELEAIERAERETAEAKRQAVENARLEAARVEREKAEAEAKQLREAEEERKAKEAARLKDEAKAKKKALEAGDKEKLTMLIDHIASLQLQSDEGKVCQNSIIGIIRKTTKEME